MFITNQVQSALAGILLCVHLVDTVNLI